MRGGNGHIILIGAITRSLVQRWHDRYVIVQPGKGKLVGCLHALSQLFPSQCWCLGCVRVFMPHRDCAGGEPSSDRHGRPKTGRESRAWRAVVAVRLSYAVACATCFQVCANCAIPALHASLNANLIGRLAANGSGRTYRRLGSSRPRQTTAAFAAEGRSSLHRNSHKAHLLATQGRRPRPREFHRCPDRPPLSVHRQQVATMTIQMRITCWVPPPSSRRVIAQ